MTRECPCIPALANLVELIAHLTDQTHRQVDIWIEHPDPNVDLAMCLIGGVFNQLDQIGKRPYYAGIPQDLDPNYRAIERPERGRRDYDGWLPEWALGYKNNLPIIRRGITATPAFRDYCGRDEFLIDAACFPGSSGSPVFILNQGLTHDKRGNTISACPG